jgi:hypothetical protein
MGSQASGSPAVMLPVEPAPPRDGRGAGLRHRPLLLAGLVLGAWVLPILTQLTSTDPLLLVVVVFGAGGLLRVGATVLDRLVITLAMLVGFAIFGGLIFSLWPWGLQPVAVGGVALTLMVAAYAWLGTPAPWRTWPRRVLGSDLVLLAAVAAGTYVAYRPSLTNNGDHADPDQTDLTAHRLAYAGLTSDRSRHFSLFDTIHRIGGYTFLKQGDAKNLIDPGMLSIYPPGQHFVYALFDIFARSNVDPGNSVAEMNRYNLYVSVGFGFFVFAVAWSARWVAGPSLTGWRRVFLVSAIVGFLSVGAYTAAIFSTWDPQVFGMALLAILTALCLRPPTSARTHIVLLAALFVAVFLTYELFAPFAALAIVISAVTYRGRWWPHWKFAVVVWVIAIPAAVSEYLVGAASGNLDTGATAQDTGFTVPLALHSLAIIAALCLVGFATRAARRRPSARAGLILTVLSGLAVVAFAVYQTQPLATSYYYQKSVQGWAVVALVSVGTAGHLLSRPRLPSRRFAGAALGCCALVLGIVATDSYWYGPIVYKEIGIKMKPGKHTTLAAVWLSGKYIYPVNESYITYLLQQGLLGDDVPTLAVVNPVSSNNTDLTIQIAVLNHDLGQISAQVYGVAGVADLTDAAKNGAAWTSDEDHYLAVLEQDIASTTVPLRIITDTAPLHQALATWSQSHPGKISKLLYLPAMEQS